MTITSLLIELNESQRIAASMPNQHLLILAGAGSGKTKTIVARAAFLISSGVPPARILILTFTRRAAAEIVERVRLHIGDAAKGLKASTFHTWCISLIRRGERSFGCKDYSIIDRDDQLQLFKLLRGKKPVPQFPSAANLCDLYSFSRNTLQTLDQTLLNNAPDSYALKPQIAQVMLAYEERKKARKYFDYDDVLDVVAQGMATSNEVRIWISSQYDCILIDEMQDTNPLQWKLIEPLKSKVALFCVGDDAQSIYAFRGADFRNIHSFNERVEGAVILKLEQNYRSTQEILNVSNWLLEDSQLNYGKKLVAVRGTGKQPQLHTFSNEWEEGRWVAEDLLHRKIEGAAWREHMILVRSGYVARAVESSLLAKQIPYRFIGGTKLMESAHVRDVLSVLRVVANPQDEIAWMRFMTLWPGVGEVTANRVIEKILMQHSLIDCIKTIQDEEKVFPIASHVVKIVAELQADVSIAISSAVKAMEDILSEKYKNQDWEKRKSDFRLVEKLAVKHTSILSFIEEYMLDPVSHSDINRGNNEDAVTIITIHSAKGMECEVCYVINVSPGAYPSKYSQGNKDDIEEERRVLYVALTRAKNELIVTRQSYNTWATSSSTEVNSVDIPDVVSTYFFNTFPDQLFEETIHKKEQVIQNQLIIAPLIRESVSMGIVIG